MPLGQNLFGPPQSLLPPLAAATPLLVPEAFKGRPKEMMLVIKEDKEPKKKEEKEQENKKEEVKENEHV